MMTEINTSEYSGPERRSMDSKMYDTVCRERFQSINSEISEVREDTQYLRAKIDNGLSEVPGRMKDLQIQQRKIIGGIISVVISFILVVIGGAGIWLYTFGRVEERLNNHIDASNYKIEQVLDSLGIEEEL